MILYNTLIGFFAGLVMLVTAGLFRLYWGMPDVVGDKQYAKERGHGVALLATAGPLTVLAGLMAVTQPLTANPPVNIAFAEPAVVLGVLGVAAGALLCGRERTRISVGPALWVVHALGWMLLSIGSAVWSYDLIGDAPKEEPITGQFTGWENPAWGAFYVVGAVACLAAPWARRTAWGHHITRWGFTVAGAALLAFSVLNYRTHIGLLLNLARDGADYRW